MNKDAKIIGLAIIAIRISKNTNENIY